MPGNNHSAGRYFFMYFLSITTVISESIVYLSLRPLPCFTCTNPRCYLYHLYAALQPPLPLIRQSRLASAGIYVSSLILNVNIISTPLSLQYYTYKIYCSKYKARMVLSNGKEQLCCLWRAPAPCFRPCNIQLIRHILLIRHTLLMCTFEGKFIYLPN